VRGLWIDAQGSVPLTGLLLRCHFVLRPEIVPHRVVVRVGVAAVEEDAGGAVGVVDESVPQVAEKSVLLNDHVPRTGSEPSVGLYEHVPSASSVSRPMYPSVETIRHCPASWSMVIVLVDGPGAV
jgi:hypothetical protein